MLRPRADVLLVVHCRAANECIARGAVILVNQGFLYSIRSVERNQPKGRVQFLVCFAVGTIRNLPVHDLLLSLTF